MGRQVVRWLAGMILLAHGVAGLPAAEPSLIHKRLVFVHSMMCFPLELKHLLPWHPEGYGALYPLQHELGLEKRIGHGWQAVDIAAARAAGVDGFAVDVFSGNCKGYWEQADAAGNFLIAPCLDLSTTPAEQKEQVAIKTISRNCELAAGHPSAARVDGALLIFTYGTRQLPPDAWRRVRQALAEQGHKTYWMPDLEADFLGKQFPEEDVTKYFPMFESGYTFVPARAYWDDLVGLFKRHGKPFGGGMMPGYYRSGAGFDDARGTELYRRRWEQHLSADLPWVCISTWNDLAENTELMPSSDWNLTRAELTRWYAARFRREPLPWTDARLYVTTPKSIYPGKGYVAEALVLNGSAKPARATIELVDGAGKSVCKGATATIAGAEAGAAVADIQIAELPAGRFMRARATLWDGGGAATSVISAPIAVLDESVMPGYRTLYYSIPAKQALAGKVGFELRGAPVGGKEGQAQVIAPAGAAVRFAEVLHNDEEVRNFNKPPFATTAPQKDRSGAILGGSEWGFYAARVVDESLRVGYSDPVYVAPAGDLALWEKYAFDEGQGKTSRDSSVYRKIAELVDVEWASGGPGGARACVRLNGKTSRVNLPLYKTPVGPMELSVAVRPAAFDGKLYADSGGLWMAFTKDGRATFTRRNAEGKWITLEGRAKLSLNQWVKLGFSWDGAAMRVFVNGRLDGEKPCSQGFKSERRALGCNPFGHGSSYFAGDLGDFELRTLTGK